MPKKVRILIFIDWFFPAFKAGGPIRSIANLVDHLHESFDFYIIAGDRDLGDKESFENIELNKWISKENFKIIYLAPVFQKTSKYRSLFKEIQPEIIYFNSLFSYQFTLKPFSALKKEKVQFLLSPRGMLGRESLNIKKYKKHIFIRIAKLTGFFRSIHWHASSQFEFNEIKNVFGDKLLIDVVPNLPVKSKKNVNLKVIDIGDTLYLLSICRISPIKNIIFLLHVLKKVKFKVVLNLIGPIEDMDYFNQCNTLIKDLPDNCSVNYLNERSPNEIRSYFSNTNLFISTSLNENYGHSIVEALSEGCPVLISNHTPWKKLENSNAGAALDLDINLFVEKLNYFKNLSNEEWIEYRIGAYDFFKKNIDLDIFRDKYLQMFNKVAQKTI